MLERMKGMETGRRDNNWGGKTKERNKLKRLRLRGSFSMPKEQWNADRRSLTSLLTSGKVSRYPSTQDTPFCFPYSDHSLSSPSMHNVPTGTSLSFCLGINSVTRYTANATSHAVRSCVQHTAVDVERLSRDVRRILRCQERHHSCHFFGRSQPAH